LPEDTPVATTRKGKKRYAHPPIEEVSCEVHFVESKTADITLPGRIFDRLQFAYPSLPRAMPVEQAAAGGAAYPPRALLSSKDEKQQLRVHENGLSVHAFAPYPGWEQFFGRVREDLSVYVAMAAPKGLVHVDLHFRNQIAIPKQTVLMHDYFTIGTTVPRGMPTRLASYVTGFRAAYEDDPRNVLTLARRRRVNATARTSCW
jgi:uncharacterized protein (TIGR04255 family)